MKHVITLASLFLLFAGAAFAAEETNEPATDADASAEAEAESEEDEGEKFPVSGSANVGYRVAASQLVGAEGDDVSFGSQVLTFGAGLSYSPIDDLSLTANLGANKQTVVSSSGADVSHDYQEAGYMYFFTVVNGEETLNERYMAGDTSVEALAAAADEHSAAIEAHLARCARLVAEAEPVEAGVYPVILSPKVAGVFAHESFGHKSEADFMLGDPSMLEAWKIGTKVGSPLLSIVDSGVPYGSGYAPWDDEGQPSKETWLIRDGVLTGRLHAAYTAEALSEELTGNARAMSFRFEPIVRMSTTWIAPGDQTKEDLFAGVKDGFFIETFKHGSGMSTFTIAPSLAWRIRDGRVAEPARVAVITGTVFETLGEIDGLSDAVEISFLVGGGCGKMEQWPLPVAFGGPYVRVAKMQVA